MDNTNEIADEMSEGRDVGGAVPYIWVQCLYNVIISRIVKK